MEQEKTIQMQENENTVVYQSCKFNKKHFFMIMAILTGIYLLIIGFVWIENITSVVDLEYFECTSNYKGNYIKGNVTCRTKALPATEDGWEKEGWYYFLIPCGKEGKYILVYADEKQYEQFKNLPEINPSKEQKWEGETVVSLKGKIEEMSGPVFYDFQEMLGMIENESIEDEIQKSKTEEGKLEKEKLEKEKLEETIELVQEQKIEEMTNIEIAIHLMDYGKEQKKKFGIVTFIWLAGGLLVLYRARGWIWETQRRSVLM